MSSNENQNNTLIPQSSDALPAPAVNQQISDGEQDNTHPLRKFHLLLRGRYHWAILLGLLGAFGFGAMGYFLTTPVYESDGLIRIRPTIRRVLYDSEQSKIMPMFESYVGSQVTMLQNTRVLNLALGIAAKSKAWRITHNEADPDALSKFIENLDIEHARNTELISVSYQDSNRKAAQVAVQSVIDAYMQLFGENDAQSQQKRMQILQNQQQNQKAQLNSLRDQILTIANQYGSDALDDIYKFNVQEQQKLDQALKDTQLSLAMAGAKSTSDNNSGSANQVAATQPQQLTVEQIAARDRHMASLLSQQQAAQQQIEMLTTRFGPRYPQVVQAKTRLHLINQAIAQYTKAYSEYAAANDSVQAIASGQSNQPTIPQLRARLSRLQTLYKDTKQQTLDLGRKKLKIDNLKSEEADVKSTLKLIDTRIQQLNTEGLVSGRIQIVSKGDMPLLTPANKSKIHQHAALGFVGGGAIGVGLIMLLGFFDRRLHRSDDALATGQSARLLGVLPTLPEDLADPQTARLAGSCVHHVRTLLQLSPQSHDCHVFAVTGPVAGTGKTSLTLSLGLSFANAGSRTLLIDSDLTAGGLTARLEAIIRRRMGQILLREGRITAGQLDEALKCADDTGKRLGEVLIEMKLVTEDQISHALELQQQASIGLLDSLAGETLDQCIADTGIEKLSILPVGGAKAHDAGRIAPAAIRQLIDQARQRFDAILIDTGPVPGNVETSIAAAAADQAILVVSRGDHRPGVERALTYLRSIGADVAGVVFNRAHSDDTSAAYATSSYVADKAEHNGEHLHDERFARFDPIARAVASSSQSKAKTNGDL